jgi:hypothetical protein
MHILITNNKLAYVQQVDLRSFNFFRKRGG